MSYLFLTIGATVLAYHMAENRGRNTHLAIAGGLLFGLLCPLYYLIVGDSPEKREAKLTEKIKAQMKSE